MKIKTTISVFAIALAAGQVQAAPTTAAEVGTLPSQRVPALLEETDRNPFGTKMAVKEDGFGLFDAESEESRIRQIFSKLSVNGYTPASAHAPARVLVGDIILKEGALVPRLIENQTDILKVTSITPKEIEITWVDDEVSDQPRRLPIPIKLEPEVFSVLPGSDSPTGGALVPMAHLKGGAGAKGAGGAQGGDQLDEGINDEGSEEQEQPAQKKQEKPKRLSPFGLFGR